MKAKIYSISELFLLISRVMKKLDFKPHKSKDDFRKNYKLHDLAENHGKNLLTQWGIDFEEFGKDKRFEKLWEKGEDKPDLIIKIGEQKFLLDWKSKHKSKWILNKRAYDSYINWSNKFSTKVIIAFFVFDENNKLSERKFAVINKHPIKENIEKQWDKNSTIEFSDELPDFTKSNLVNQLL